MPKFKREIRIEMTGSPRSHGFKTKQKFLDALESYNVYPCKLQNGAEYLITNDLSSKTAKMKMAKMMHLKIRTYSQFVNEFKEIARVKKLQEIMDKINS